MVNSALGSRLPLEFTNRVLVVLEASRCALSPLIRFISLSYYISVSLLRMFLVLFRFFLISLFLFLFFSLSSFSICLSSLSHFLSLSLSFSVLLCMNLSVNLSNMPICLSDYLPPYPIPPILPPPLSHLTVLFLSLHKSFSTWRLAPGNIALRLCIYFLFTCYFFEYIYAIISERDREMQRQNIVYNID